MSKHDENAALAEALRAPLEAGSLEAALHSARAFFMRHPGDDDAKRVVEALELFMAQVWFGGTGEGGEPDPRYAMASQHLESLDFPGALARYEEIAQSDGSAENARRLALRVRVVIAALAGQALPLSESAVVAPAVEAMSFEDSTRVAGEGELPLAAFAYDDVTAGVTPHIPPEAYPEEPTRTLMLGDYELFEEAAAAVVDDDDDQHTRVRDVSELEAPKPPPPAPKKPAKKAAETKKAATRTRTTGSPDDREVTRVASAGELPLEELRKEMESQADTDLDEMLGSTVEPAAPQPVSSERASPEPKPRPKNEPRVIESSLVLDITVEDLDFGQRDDAPPAVIVLASEPRGPAVPPPPSAPPASQPSPEIEPAPSLERPTPAPVEAPAPPPEPSSPRIRAQARTEAHAPLPARISAPASEPRISFVPLPSAPTPTEPPLPRAPEPVAAGEAPSSPSIALPVAPLVIEASYSKPPSVATDLPNKIDPAQAKPKRAFKPILKDAPRSSLPSVPPPVVRAPEIAPRGSAAPPARPKSAPPVPIAPPRSAPPAIQPGRPAHAPPPTSAAPASAPMPAAPMPPAPISAPPPPAPMPAAPMPAPQPPAPISAPPAPMPAPIPAPQPPVSISAPPPAPMPAAPSPASSAPPSTPPPSITSTLTRPTSAPPPAPPPVGVPPSPPAAPAPVGVPPLAPASSSVPAPSVPALDIAVMFAEVSITNVDPTATLRGPAVPPPPGVPRGPAVPPPPGPSMPSYAADPVHARLETRDVALPAEGQWAIREPGADDDTGPHLPIGEPSWTGARSPETTFEPGAAPIEADSWADPPAAPALSEQAAEALLARGELREALRMYQELAVSRPDEPHLWERVGEIARMLQSRS